MIRNHQRGSAMLVTVILIAALLSGVAVLVSMQLTSNRSGEATRSSMTALYCAEAGLVAARAVVRDNYASWATAIAASGAGDTSEPSWLVSGIGSHDLDSDGVADFAVYIRDNDDEPSTMTNDPTIDNDLRVFVVSRCVKYPDAPKQVQELLQMQGGGNCYQSQQGGCDGNNNSNI